MINLHSISRRTKNYVILIAPRFHDCRKCTSGCTLIPNNFIFQITAKYIFILFESSWHIFFRAYLIAPSTSNTLFQFDNRVSESFFIFLHKNCQLGTGLNTGFTPKAFRFYFCVKKSITH